MKSAYYITRLNRARVKSAHEEGDESSSSQLNTETPDWLFDWKVCLAALVSTIFVV